MVSLITYSIPFPLFPHPIGVAGIAGKTEPSCFFPFRESRERYLAPFGTSQAPLLGTASTLNTHIRNSIDEGTLCATTRQNGAIRRL